MNTVFIVLDTVRKDRLSVYNDEVDFTNNIENFAEKATVFNDAVAQAPWTLPSHASIFTGLYPWEHNATQQQLYLDTEKTLLAEKFSKEGYKTACYTSNTWITPYTGMASGFDDVDNFFGVMPNNMMSDKTEKVWRWMNKGKAEWFMNKLIQIGEKFHWMTAGMNASTKTPAVIDKAQKFIEQNRDEDFFLFLNFMDAHLPYYPPEEYREKHAPDVDPKEICQEAHNHNGGTDEADFEASKKLYDAEIDFLDDQLGNLFQYFEDEDLMEDTVFVVVADHGENLGENDMMGHQFSVSEQLVSVPMMIKSPGLDQKEVDQQVELRQLYDIVPKISGLESNQPVFEEGKALGGYQRPRMDLKNIPEEKQPDLDKRLSFVRGSGNKLVRSENEELSEDTMFEIKTGSEIDIDSEFVSQLDRIGEADEGSTDIEEEQVKERLEELGYM